MLLLFDFILYYVIRRLRDTWKPQNKEEEILASYARGRHHDASSGAHLRVGLINRCGIQQVLKVLVDHQLARGC